MGNTVEGNAFQNWTVHGRKDLTERTVDNAVVLDNMEELCSGDRRCDVKKEMIASSQTILQSTPYGTYGTKHREN